MFKNIVVSLTANSAQYQSAMMRAQAQTRALGNTQRTVATQSATLGRAVGSAGQQIGGAAAMVGGMNAALIGGAGLVMALKSTVGAAVRFEHEFANVRKTVGGTDTQMAKIAGEIRGLSRELPATTTELNAVAAAAGQLGVAKDQLAEFTREMTMVGVATDMTSDQAAMDYARLANITNTPLENIRELTSVTVALGNQFAAQEGEIVNFAMRVAGAGTQVGLTTDQIFALSTALPAMGLRAEMGGSAVSRIMTEIATSVDSGSEELDEFARVSGMTVEQFSAAWRDDAANAFLTFLEGLQKAGAAGESTFQIIEELGLSAIRTQDTLLRGSSAAGEYARALGVAGDEMKDLTAIEEEYQTFADTTSSQWQIFKNNMADAALTAGETLKPALDGVLATLNQMMGPNGPLAKTPTDQVSIEDFVKPGASEGLGGFLRDLFGANLGQSIEQLGAFGDEVSEFTTTAGQDYLKWLGEAAKAGDTVALETLRNLRSEFDGQHVALTQQADDLIRFAETQKIADAEVARFERRAGQVTTALGGTHLAVREAASAVDAAGYSGRLAADAWSSYAHEVDSTSEAIDNYNDRLRAMEDPIFAVEQATSGLVEEREKLAELQEAGKTGTDEYEAQLWAVASAASEQEARLLDLWAAMDDGQFTAEQAEARFRELGESAGLTETDISRLIDEIGGFVDRANDLEPVKVELDARAQAETEARLAQMQADFDALFGHIDAELDVERVMKAEADVREGRMTVDAFARFMDEEISRARVAELKADATSGISVVDSFTAAADRAVLKERRAEIDANAEPGVRVIDSFTRMADRAIRDRSMAINVRMNLPRLPTGMQWGAGGLPRVSTNHAGGMAGTGPMTSGALRPDELLAKLQAGEFVVNREATSRNRSLLEAINAKTFHAGGAVGGGDGYDIPSLYAMTRGPSGGSSRGHLAAIQSMREAYEAMTREIEEQEQAARRIELVEQRRAAETAEEREKATEALREFDREARLSAERRQIEDRIAAAEANQRLSANREAFLFDRMSTEQQLANLDRRIAAEQRYSDEWVRLWEERERLMADEVRRTEEAANESLDQLNRMLDERDRVLADQARTEARYDKSVAAEKARHAEASAQAQQRYLDQVAQANRDYAAAVEAAEGRTREAIESTVAARRSQLEAQMSLEMDGWNFSASGMTRFVDRQLEELDRHEQALEEARSRGVSDAVVAALGLDSGPEALEKLEILLRSSDEQLVEMSEAIARRQAAIDARVGRERTDSRSQLAQDLADLERDHASALEDLRVEHADRLLEAERSYAAERETARGEHFDRLATLEQEFLDEQAAFAVSLAAIGANQGRGWTQAIEEGIAAGIPGIAAQVAEVQRMMREMEAAQARAGTTSAVASIRASLGLPAEAASDAIWDRRISEGTHTLADAIRRLEDRAGSRYAEGGLHVAQIARAGDLRVWAEPETGGEAYIPLGASKRGRSTAILADVAKRFGYGLVPMARGGIYGAAGSAAGGSPVHKHYHLNIHTSRSDIDVAEQFHRMELLNGG